MITLTDSTVLGRTNTPAADVDSDVLAVALALGWTGSDAWYAAEFLRDVYRAVIRSAGSVDLVVPAAAAVTVAA